MCVAHQLNNDNSERVYRSNDYIEIYAAEYIRGCISIDRSILSNKKKGGHPCGESKEIPPTANVHKHDTAQTKRNEYISLLHDVLYT